MQGIGVRPARGFWADAWSQVTRRRAAVAGLIWLAIVAFFAVYAPVLASGHPVWMVSKGADGSRLVSSPLWQNLSSIDLLLLVWASAGVPYALIGPKAARAKRAGRVLVGLLFAVAVLAVAGVLQTNLESRAQDVARELSTRAARTGEAVKIVTPFARQPWAGYLVAGIIASVGLLLIGLIPGGVRGRRLLICAIAGVVVVWAVGVRWQRPLEQFAYERRERAGEIEARYTLVPWSPFQRFSELSRKEPGSSRWRALVDEATQPLPLNGRIAPEQVGSLVPKLGELMAAAGPDAAKAASKAAVSLDAGSLVSRQQVRRAIDRPLSPQFAWGTDKDGADVLSQLLHACRLSISIGLVSTSVALLIGVTIGALMGYFGGWVDLLLYRIVEIFMAVPVLFLLIVAVAVLPEELKTTYVIMAIIGCFTWTGMARFTRAEFMKLRHQDFVQAAQAAGLPLHSVLFRHMLPNGVAPVLVDTSFAIAAAISIEATLSYLGLGPSDSASWGKLLSSAISSEGEFKWWLAVFPGAAIFLTVLSYNLLGETLRDAIDPKLKKARV
jgi:ABC-type dipeptide/oligopeptide/nickel transport system permease subunit